MPPFVDEYHPICSLHFRNCLFFVKSIYVKSHTFVVKKVELDRIKRYIYPETAHE